MAPPLAQRRVHGEVHEGRAPYHIILNAYWEPREFELPSVSDGGGHPWRRWIDTFLESPRDIVEWEHAPRISGHWYRAEPRSVVVLYEGVESRQS